MQDNSQSGTHTQTYIIRCNSKEDVYVQVVDISSSRPSASLHPEDTTFSAFLICEG